MNANSRIWADVGMAISLAGLVVVGCSSRSDASARREAVDGGGGKSAIGSLGGPCTSGGACDPGLYCAGGLCAPVGGTGGGGVGGVSSSSGGAGANPSGGFGTGLTDGAGGAGETDGGGGSNHVNPDAACDSQSKRAEALPVDMYIMFDQSTSMSDPLPDNSGSWWTAAQAAVTSFVNNNRATGMGVGLQYFGLPHSVPGCTSFSTLAGDCCDPAVYQKPEIEIGLLPANAAPLSASIAAHSPVSFTPTLPALQGAIDHMKAWAPQHLGRAPVVVFVTDGFPTTCASTTDVDNGAQISDVALLAKTAFETDPKVRTFVVGFNSGQGLGNLDQIAKAGGTGKAFMIAGGNIGDTFVNAMLSIAATPLQCSFDLPKPAANMTLDTNKVDVSYTPAATLVPEPVAKLNNLGDCQINNNQGWYYDSPGSPTKIEICPGTCARFAAGTVNLLSGCLPVIDMTLH
jgi:hypothetical protein